MDKALSHKVVGVDNIGIAKNVIRSLRSSANNSKLYKQDTEIVSIEVFNKIITDKANQFKETISVATRMDEAIVSYKPPISNTSPPGFCKV